MLHRREPDLRDDHRDDHRADHRAGERAEVVCDVCGVVLDDAMAHVQWHLYLNDLSRHSGSV